MSYRTNSRPPSPGAGEDAQAIALLYGAPYEQELERAQNQIDHFRQILDKRVIASVQEAKKSKTLRTISEMMVGLTALLFLFVLYLKTPRAAPGTPERCGAPSRVAGLRG